VTPTLDSLAKISWFFSNAYSAGIHTNNGIFSTLYALPALKGIRPMSSVPVNKYSGLPYTLKQNGYRTAFYTTHSESFDNMRIFLPGNYFDSLYSAEDYPADKLIGPFGAADDYMFDYAIRKFNALDTAKPFFATLLTTSNHDPYVLPDYFKSSINSPELRAVAYADWAISGFLKKASRQPWFSHTVFIFMSDHGRIVGSSPYDLQLSYHHVPLIVYAPSLLKEPKELPQFCGQVDVFPTLMHLLNVSYMNNTLGLDVLSQSRECIYFSSDNKLGCLDDKWLYVYRYDGGESLYDYRSGDPADHSAEQKEEFEKLKRCALSSTQAAEWLILNNKTEIKK
jgi:phosphoglycerol transferase MdoB-like AlkP superfamily enzyme